MRRHLTEPFDAGVFHQNAGIETLGDGMRYDGLALFLEQGDQLFLLGNQGIDLGQFPVEQSNHCNLLITRGKRHNKVIEVFCRQSPST
jgi:hypothetical protein